MREGAETFALSVLPLELFVPFFRDILVHSEVLCVSDPGGAISSRWGFIPTLSIH